MSVSRVSFIASAKLDTSSPAFTNGIISIDDDNDSIIFLIPHHYFLYIEIIFSYRNKK